MAQIFLSFSSMDEARASEVEKEIIGFGYASIFFSGSCENYIWPGLDWEQKIYSALRDVRVQVRDALSGESIAEFAGRAVRYAEPSQSGAYMAVAYQDDAIGVWDTRFAAQFRGRGLAAQRGAKLLPKEPERL